MQEGSRKAVIAAFAANAGIAVAKFVGFAITGASSMLAEAVHSVADTGNQGLLLLGASRGSRRASEAHPFGYGRERYFWAFIVALVIFSLGGVFAVTEGIEKLHHPHPVKRPMVAVGILLAAVLLEGWSFLTALKEARRHRGEHSWMEFIRRTKAAELPVILLEDLGALVGLVFALAGVGLSLMTGDPRFDAIGSIAIGALLMAIAVVLAVEMRSLLIGESATPEQIEEVRAALLEGGEIQRLLHMRTNHLGPDQLLVAAKVQMEETMSFVQVAQAIDRAEDRVRARVPTASMIYLEPDILKASDPGS